jgi:hypothetical protein
MTRPTPLPLRVGAKQKTFSGPSWRTSAPRRVQRVRVLPAESMVVRNSASSVWQRTTPAPSRRPARFISSVVAQRELPWARLWAEGLRRRAAMAATPAPARAATEVMAPALRKRIGARGA